MDKLSSGSIVAIIPARYASTRLPAKPLVSICGKPMIQHVYERTKQSKLVSTVVVATDDERIVAAVKRFGGDVVLTPVDIRSGSDRVAHVARNLAGAGIIVNIQGDEPLIEPAMIDQAVQPLIDDPAIPVGTLVRKISLPEELLDPNVVKAVLDANGFAVYFSRSPIPYLRDEPLKSEWHSKHGFLKHIGIYVFRKEFLLQFAGWGESVLERTEKLEQLRIIDHGYKIKAVMTEFDSIPVDTLQDAERVDGLLRQQLSGKNS